MTDNKDIVLTSAFKIPDVAPVNQKPSYLLSIKDDTGKRNPKYFIAIEQPALESAYVKVKGIFVNKSEEEIIANYASIISDLTIDKKNIIECWYPWSGLNGIRSLVYRADKSK